MKILVTNDDGIHSPGLWAAVDALKDAGEVFVVAPDRDQSGVGASLTLRAPIRASEFPVPVTAGVNGIKAYSVEGTPGDCSVLALEQLVGPVDLLVSGINQGSNLGEDTLISGTVGAALQGYVRGYPSVAISVAAVKDVRFEVAAALLKTLVARMEKIAGVSPLLLNINVPNEPPTAVGGAEVTRLGGRSYGETVTSGNDGRRTYYWLSRNKRLQQGNTDHTDIAALGRNLISITPIRTGLTDLEKMPLLEEILRGVSSEVLGRSG